MRDAWALTCYFNPMGWKSRLRNYRCFRRHLGIPLVTVEWSPSGRFELGAGDADVLVQVGGGDLMWQKERLLALGLHRLPAEADLVVWLDCEVLFLDPAWASAARAELERCEVLQPFARALYLDPAATRGIVEGAPLGAPAGGGVVASARLLLDEGADALVDADLRGHKDLAGARLPRIPGLAWAARRETLEAVGFFERAIIGSGDWFWMLGVLGGAERWLATAGGFGYGYLARSTYPDWARRAYERVRGRVGCLDGTVLHLYHGQVANRRYKSRHEALSAANLDVETDLVTTPKGVWRFHDPRPEWLRLMRSYFLGREEDDSL